MCRYGNAFIPMNNKNTPTILSAPEGLVVSYDEPFQTNFSALHKEYNGILIALHDGHCLCDYKDWGTLFDYLESIRSHNNLEKVEFLLYWSDDVYPLTNRVVIDMDLDSIKEIPVEGVIYEITVATSRRLEQNIGNQIHLVFKSGKEYRGILSSYDAETGNGILQSLEPNNTLYFHYKEIASVDRES
ncbi:MAG: hypothetical protein ACFFF4_06415 [Candidatus Thorarchaeota archaeon]